MNELQAVDLHWIDDLINALMAKAPEWGMRLVGATLTFFIGWWIVKWINNAVKNYFLIKDFDQGLETFLESLINIMLKVCLVLTTAATMGVELTSFMAIFGSAGLAIGFAFSGTLSNFAGGIIILLLKPYKVGDVIEAQGYVGKVDSIQIFSTHLKTLDTKTVIIPNGKLANESLVNYTAVEFRKVVWTFGISYGDDAELAKKLLLEIVNADERVLQEPDVPFVAMSALSNSSVDFTLRAWTRSEEFWNVYWAVNEIVYNTFPKNGLSIPFPQMDVHIKNS
jgi:small conductance mechanosensitive channel